MAFSPVVKNQFDSATIVLRDGTTPTPLSVTVRLDQGDYSLTGLTDKQRARTAYQSRGVVHSVRHTERTFPALSFSAMVSDLSEASAGTVLDFLRGRAGTPYAARKSTMPGDVFCCDVIFTMEKTDLGDAADEPITTEDVAFDFDFTEGDPNTLSYSGEVFGEVTGV